MYAELAPARGTNACNLALSDWFNPPVIHEVTRQAGRIRVDATDNVLVAKVVVSISDEERQILEQGIVQNTKHSLLQNITFTILLPQRNHSCKEAAL
jgi:hypothetical protein